jgi:hypothetical protein
MPSFSFEVEYAKSNRAGCKKCKEKIDKGSVRLGIKQEAAEDAEGPAAHFGCMWHHFACFAECKGKVWFKKHLTPEVAENVPGLEQLQANDRAAVAALFQACRGEGPVPPTPNAPAADENIETPAKSSKKRKSEKGIGDNEGAPAKAAKAPVLSEIQLAAIEEAKVALASKNNAFLGAVLSKNGLPKAGRKNELIDRVAENKVLGVPPTCDVCEKKKLQWSRVTGKYSCPGFFDEASASFKRCTGPTSTDVERTPWEDI